MLYQWLKFSTSIFFNLFNKLIGGNLPPFGSAVVLVTQNDKYLVVELPNRRIVFPGGFMTWREKPWETAEREGREETGFQVHTSELIGVYTSASRRMTEMSNLCFIYAAQIVGGEIKRSPEGQPLWLSEAELRQRMRPDLLGILDDYLGVARTGEGAPIAGTRANMQEFRATTSKA
jgi:ADP-ribose pyrophosphatase YjhB (NUDIX family)